MTTTLLTWVFYGTSIHFATFLNIFIWSRDFASVAPNSRQVSPWSSLQARFLCRFARRLLFVAKRRRARWRALYSAFLAHFEWRSAVQYVLSLLLHSNVARHTLYFMYGNELDNKTVSAIFPLSSPKRVKRNIQSHDW